MLDKILALDKELLIFLNGLGSSTFDPFWLFITKQSNWTPFFLVLLYLILHPYIYFINIIYFIKMLSVIFI